MAGLLNVAYSVAVLLVAVAGIVYVLGFVGDDPRDDGFDWLAAAVGVLVALFLAVMLAELMGVAWFSSPLAAPVAG